ncbi:MAG: isoprenyl transferase [Candidatus Eisenbacteria bacterium]|nr:isoprenyl transferase [Candidatus Latescibacterota bacterium]MBD3303481.1 isoprenyl transferase [Candidatus Eisenbacteria bacterium]
MASDPGRSTKERNLRQGNLPRHIAIIMDGNGRWATRQGLPRIAGHHAGRRAVRDVVEGCADLGIEVLTLYTFSVENWNRPAREVGALMTFLSRVLREEREELMRNNVRLGAWGHLEDLPAQVRRELAKTQEMLSGNRGLRLFLALSYGGRAEIVDAVQAIARKVQTGEIAPESIDEATFAAHLYTAGIPCPDLLIRTSGEMRLSNFLLWQLAYSEIYVTDVLWPDFRRKHLEEAIVAYQGRDRRFGRVDPARVIAG